MTILSSTRLVTGGVDTHLDQHVAAVVDAVGSDERRAFRGHLTLARVGRRLVEVDEIEGNLNDGFQGGSSE